MPEDILTSAEIAEIERLDAARTQGEWFDIPHPQWAGAEHRIGCRQNESWGNFGQLCFAAPNDAAYIAACSVMVQRLLATIQAYRELLAEAMNWDHWAGCSGGIPNPEKPDGWAYPCKCGFRSWAMKVEKLLE